MKKGRRGTAAGAGREREDGGSVGEGGELCIGSGGVISWVDHGVMVV